MESQKILFVDDDPEIREVLRLLLESEGYQVIEAVSGEQVLEKLDDSVGLVILDVMMPDMNGYGVCAESARQCRYCFLPQSLRTRTRPWDFLPAGTTIWSNRFLIVS